MASGQAPDSWASGTTNGSIGAADEGAAGAATGAGAAAAGCSAGVGAGCIRKADGAGKGVEGLMGDDVNGELGVIGCTGCWAGACRAAGFGAETGADAGASLGEIAGSGGAGGAGALAGAPPIRSADMGWPLGPKMPPTSSGTATFF